MSPQLSSILIACQIVTHLSMSAVYCLNRREVWLRYGQIRPVITEIRVGQSATLFCGSFSPPEWIYCQSEVDIIYRCSRIGLSPGPYVLERNKLIFMDFESEQEGWYYCRGTYPDKRPFRAATYVSQYTNARLGEIVPSFIGVPKDSTITLTCGSEGLAEWFGSNLHNMRSMTVGNSLTLNNLKKEHSGLYFCQGTMKNLVFNAIATIIVDGYTNVSLNIDHVPFR